MRSKLASSIAILLNYGAKWRLLYYIFYLLCLDLNISLILDKNFVFYNRNSSQDIQSKPIISSSLLTPDGITLNIFGYSNLPNKLSHLSSAYLYGVTSLFLIALLLVGSSLANHSPLKLEKLPLLGGVLTNFNYFFLLAGNWFFMTSSCIKTYYAQEKLSDKELYKVDQELELKRHLLTKYSPAINQDVSCRSVDHWFLILLSLSLLVLASGLKYVSNKITSFLPVTKSAVSKNSNADFCHQITMVLIMFARMMFVYLVPATNDNRSFDKKVLLLYLTFLSLLALDLLIHLHFWPYHKTSSNRNRTFEIVILMGCTILVITELFVHTSEASKTQIGVSLFLICSFVAKLAHNFGHSRANKVNLIHSLFEYIDCSFDSDQCQMKASIQKIFQNMQALNKDHAEKRKYKGPQYTSHFGGTNFTQEDLKSSSEKKYNSRKSSVFGFFKNSATRESSSNEIEENFNSLDTMYEGLDVRRGLIELMKRFVLRQELRKNHQLLLDIEKESPFNAMMKFSALDLINDPGDSDLKLVIVIAQILLENECNSPSKRRNDSFYFRSLVYLLSFYSGNVTKACYLLQRAGATKTYKHLPFDLLIQYEMIRNRLEMNAKTSNLIFAKNRGKLQFKVTQRNFTDFSVPINYFRTEKKVFDAFSDILKIRKKVLEQFIVGQATVEFLYKNSGETMKNILESCKNLRKLESLTNNRSTQTKLLECFGSLHIIQNVSKARRIINSMAGSTKFLCGLDHPPNNPRSAEAKRLGLFGFHENTAILGASMEEENFHTFNLIGSSVEKFLGYEPNDLYGKDISTVIPNPIALNHHKLFSPIACSGKLFESKIGLSAFVLNFDRHAREAWLAICLNSSLENGLQCVARLGFSESTPQFFMFSENILYEVNSEASNHFKRGTPLNKISTKLSSIIKLAQQAEDIVQQLGEENAFASGNKLLKEALSIKYDSSLIEEYLGLKEGRFIKLKNKEGIHIKVMGQLKIYLSDRKKKNFFGAFFFEIARDEGRDENTQDLIKTNSVNSLEHQLDTKIIKSKEQSSDPNCVTRNNDSDKDTEVIPVKKQNKIKNDNQKDSLNNIFLPPSERDFQDNGSQRPSSTTQPFLVNSGKPFQLSSIAVAHFKGQNNQNPSSISNPGENPSQHLASSLLQTQGQGPQASASASPFPLPCPSARLEAASDSKSSSSLKSDPPAFPDAVAQREGGGLSFYSLCHPPASPPLSRGSYILQRVLTRGDVKQAFRSIKQTHRQNTSDLKRQHDAPKNLLSKRNLKRQSTQSYGAFDFEKETFQSFNYLGTYLKKTQKKKNCPTFCIINQILIIIPLMISFAYGTQKYRIKYSVFKELREKIEMIDSSSWPIWNVAPAISSIQNTLLVYSGLIPDDFYKSYGMESVTGSNMIRKKWSAGGLQKYSLQTEASLLNLTFYERVREEADARTEINLQVPQVLGNLKEFDAQVTSSSQSTPWWLNGSKVMYHSVKTTYETALHRVQPPIDRASRINDTEELSRFPAYDPSVPMSEILPRAKKIFSEDKSSSGYWLRLNLPGDILKYQLQTNRIISNYIRNLGLQYSEALNKDFLVTCGQAVVVSLIFLLIFMLYGFFTNNLFKRWLFFKNIEMEVEKDVINNLQDVLETLHFDSYSGYSERKYILNFEHILEDYRDFSASARTQTTLKANQTKTENSGKRMIKSKRALINTRPKKNALNIFQRLSTRQGTYFFTITKLFLRVFLLQLCLCLISFFFYWPDMKQASQMNNLITLFRATSHFWVTQTTLQFALKSIIIHNFSLQKVENQTVDNLKTSENLNQNLKMMGGQRAEDFFRAQVRFYQEEVVERLEGLKGKDLNNMTQWMDRHFYGSHDFCQFQKIKYKDKFGLCGEAGASIFKGNYLFVIKQIKLLVQRFFDQIININHQKKNNGVLSEEESDKNYAKTLEIIKDPSYQAYVAYTDLHNSDATIVIYYHILGEITKTMQKELRAVEEEKKGQDQQSFYTKLFGGLNLVLISGFYILVFKEISEIIFTSKAIIGLFPVRLIYGNKGLFMIIKKANSK